MASSGNLMYSRGCIVSRSNSCTHGCTCCRRFLQGLANKQIQYSTKYPSNNSDSPNSFPSCQLAVWAGASSVVPRRCPWSHLVRLVKLMLSLQQLLLLLFVFLFELRALVVRLLREGILVFSGFVSLIHDVKIVVYSDSTVWLQSSIRWHCL